MGVNLGEAVNFAAADWLRFGAAALGRVRHFRKPCVVAQEEMLLRLAREQVALAAADAAAAAEAAAGGDGAAGGGAGSGDGATGSPRSPGGGAARAASPLTCYYLSKELARVVEEEWVLRAKLWSQGAPRPLAPVPPVWPGAGSRGSARLPAARARLPPASKRRRLCTHRSPLGAPASAARADTPPRRAPPLQACAARGARRWRWASTRARPTTPSARSATCTCTCRQARSPTLCLLWSGRWAAKATLRASCCRRRHRLMAATPRG